jgi:hypothetical protein
LSMVFSLCWLAIMRMHGDIIISVDVLVGMSTMLMLQKTIIIQH